MAPAGHGLHLAAVCLAKSNWWWKWILLVKEYLAGSHVAQVISSLPFESTDAIVWRTSTLKFGLQFSVSPLDILVAELDIAVMNLWTILLCGSPGYSTSACRRRRVISSPISWMCGFVGSLLADSVESRILMTGPDRYIAGGLQSRKVEFSMIVEMFFFVFAATRMHPAPLTAQFCSRSVFLNWNLQPLIFIAPLVSFDEQLEKVQFEIETRFVSCPVPLMEPPFDLASSPSNWQWLIVNSKGVVPGV